MGKRGVEHKPTSELKFAIRNMAGFLNQDELAKHFKIDVKTLTKHYKEEIENAQKEDDAAVYKNLHRLASKGDNPTAAIFWAKCRMRWKEVQQIEHTGKDGEALIPSINVTIKGTGSKL